jgi:hypothetical protein
MAFCIELFENKVELTAAVPVTMRMLARSDFSHIVIQETLAPSQTLMPRLSGY